MRMDVASQRRFTCPMANRTRTIVSSFSTPRREHTSGIGAPMERGPDDAAAAAPVNPCGPASQAVRQCRPLRADSIVTASSMSATAATADFRSSVRTAGFVREIFVAKGSPERRNGLRSRLLARSEVHLRRRWRESESLGYSAATRCRSSGRSATRARRRPVCDFSARL